jgi:flagellar hook protein FlgE
MSISGSMLTARTALDAFHTSIEVIGHNIANLNTAGFKASRAEFADLLPTTHGQVETGHGVRLAKVDRPFQQGAFETTSNTTDLAVNGKGFFVLRDARGGTFYTRAGQFQLDPSRNLVNPDGLFVQGVGGNISVAAFLTSPARATSSLNLDFNLDAASATPVTPFPAGPDASRSAWSAASNFSVAASIYDASGAAHDLTFLFRKNAANIWDYRVVANRSELDAGAPTSTELRSVSAGGTLVFNPDGSLNSGLSMVSDINGLTWVGRPAQSIQGSSLDFSGVTQYGQPSTLFSLGQNGRFTGALSAVTIDRQGIMTGRYSNGTSQVLNTLQLATFNNVDALDPVGDTLFVPSTTSGAPLVGQPGQGGRGEIIAGALELSTVDLADEFVSMISSQRAFQMNSRVITIADQMYSVAADLKR